MKQCKGCLSTYPATLEYFYKNKGNKDGLHSYCRECANNKAKQYYFENKEQRDIQKKEYYNENKEEILKHNREYKRNHKQEILDYYKKWTKENKDKVKLYKETRAMNKQHEISKEEWENCLKYFNFECAYCGISEEVAVETHGQVLHKEHVDHEGENDLSNNVPACKSCNSKKWTFSLEEWYTEDNEVFSIERYNKILDWICKDYINYIKI